MIRLIAFDWGDTLMRELNPNIKMIDAPEVFAMPGAADMLAVLSAAYRLVIATNATLSNAAEVRAALGRVGLDGFFSDILTALELGVSKPDPAYFQAVLNVCGCAPQEAVMVGDSFNTDILGAKQAGLWAVWYNWRGTALPPDSPAHPDAVIADLGELAAVIQALDGRAAE